MLHDHKGQREYKADSTKVAKIIAMLLGGKLLGPDLGPKRVIHYTYENNAFQGVSRVQLLPRVDSDYDATTLPYLEVTEKGGDLVDPDAGHHAVVKLVSQKGSTTCTLRVEVIPAHLNQFFAFLSGKEEA